LQWHQAPLEQRPERMLKLILAHKHSPQFVANQFNSHLIFDGPWFNENNHAMNACELISIWFFARGQRGFYS
jgi:hypothetical protein